MVAVCISALELIPRNEENQNASNRRGVPRAPAGAVALNRWLAFAGPAC